MLQRKEEKEKKNTIIKEIERRAKPSESLGDEGGREDESIDKELKEVGTSAAQDCWNHVFLMLDTALTVFAHQRQ